MPAVVQTSTTTPGGRAITIATRTDSNDEALVNGILGTDEYELTQLEPLSGWALDIGAHVGSVTFALAADHPGLSIVAVEPVPENADLLRQSVALNGMTGRVHIVEASLGPKGTATLPCRYGYTKVGDVDSGFVTQNTWIGNIWRLSDAADGTAIDSPVVTLDGLAETFGVERWAFVKIDCEGCEWEGLTAGTERIDLMVGEWHDSPVSQLADILAATHDVSVITDYGGSGIFRAVRRG